jgi:hypothetical protein
VGTPVSDLLVTPRRGGVGCVLPQSERGGILAVIAGRIGCMDATANPASGVPSGVPNAKKPRLEGKRMASGDIGKMSA